jgi:hypothetical protein
LSRKGRDLNARGFYAASETSEIKCPDMEANQLLDIVPVSERLRAATNGKEGREFGEAETAAIAVISQECSTAIDIRCDVVKLYHGGQYDLYKYRRFQDVRLIFAPEESIAFFGGDPDNFEFPRCNLDVAFLRLYVAGKPFLNRDYLPLAPTTISFPSAPSKAMWSEDGRSTRSPKLAGLSSARAMRTRTACRPRGAAPSES